MTLIISIFYIYTKHSLRSFVISVILFSSNNLVFFSMTSEEERLPNEFGGGEPSSDLSSTLNSFGIF